MQRWSTMRRLPCAKSVAFPCKVLCVLVLSLAGLALTSPRAEAANPIWNNTGTDFNANGSWDTNIAPTSSTVAVFSGAANSTFLPDLTANLTVSGLDFTTVDAAGYTLSSNGGFTLSLASTSNVIGSAAISGRNTSGTNTINAAIGLLTTGSSTQTFDQATGGTMVFGGQISGGNANTTLALRDGGTFTFNVANNYTGTTSLGGGSAITTQVVNIGNNSAFGSSNLVLSTGGVTLNAVGGTRTLANNIQLASSNISTLSGTNDFILNGNFSQDSNNRTLLISNNGKTTLNGTIFLSNSASTGRTMTFGGTAALEIAGAVVDSSVNGSTAQSTLGYSGSGSLLLSSTTSNYAGGFTVTGAGLVTFKNTGVFGTGPVTYGASGNLDNGTGATATLTNAFNLSGGSLTFVGTNDLNLSSAVTITGANRTITVTNAAATLTLNGGINDASQARNFTKAGAGTVIVNSSSNYSGATAVSGGTLVMNVASNATGTTLTNGGTLKLNQASALGTGTLAFGNGGGVLTLGSGLTINSGNAVTVAVGSTLNGVSGSSITFGSLTSLANSSQSYTVDNIDVTFTTGDLASSTVTVNGARIMTLNGSGNVTFTGAIGVTNTDTTAKNSGLTYAGSGSLNVQGNATYGGATTVNSGTVTFGGSIAGALTVNGGSMTANGNVTGAILVANGTLNVGGVNANTTGTTIGTASTANAPVVTLTGVSGALGTGPLSIIGGTFDLNGHTQSITTLSMGGGSSTSTAAMTLGGGTLSLGGDVSFSSTNNPLGATISGTGAISLNGNRNFTVNDSTNAASDMSVGSTIQNGSGTSALTKLGGGTLRLTGSSTYSGGTFVNAGAISVDAINGNGGVGTGNISLGLTTVAGTLIYTGGGETTARVITLAGTTGGGVLDASGSGLLKLTSDIANPGVAGGSSAKNLILQGTGTGEIGGKIVDATAGTTGNLAANVLKLGSGTWTLSGANTYSGTTNIGATGGADGGTLKLSGSGVVGNGTNTSGVITVYAGTLDFNGISQTVGTLAVGGGASGTTANISLGAGTVTLGGNLSYSSTNNPNGGTISGVGGGILHTGNANRSITVGDSSAAANDLTISAIISGSGTITKAGGGVLVFSGANNYSGTTQIGASNADNSTAGTLKVTGAGKLSNAQLTIVAGTLDIDGTTQTLTTISFGGSGLAGSSTEVKMGGGTLNVNGNVAYSTANNNNGVLVSGGGVWNLGGATRTYTIADSTAVAADVTINASLQNGALTRAGLGTLVLTGTNLYSGTTTLAANGTTIVGVNGSGSIANSAVSISGHTLGGDGTVGSITTTGGNIGFVSPGFNQAAAVTPALGTAVLTSTGNVSVTGGAHLVFDLSKAPGTAKPIAGTDYDQLVTTTGTVTLTTADLFLNNNWSGAIQNNDVFYLISNGSASAVTGTFASLNGTATTLTQGSNFTLNGMTFQISYNANYTGNVNTSVFSGSGNDVALQAISVPEPATVGLMGLATLGLLRRRRSAK